MVRRRANRESSAGRRRIACEAGSVLVLVPAAFLVLLLLASLAVDSAVAYQAQQQLHDSLTAAANDAVAAGLDESRFYSGQGVGLDPSTTGLVVCQAINAQGAGSSLRDVRVALAISGDSLRLTGSASFDPVFGRALPGLGARSVRSSAEATLASGPDTQASGQPLAGLASGTAAPSASYGAPVPLNCGP
ncbi:MAG: hypothetical protein M0Z30_22470 [Actinomycetota bacterium]|nr:hypothetical protein [Actinomycetota bacterium]